MESLIANSEMNICILYYVAKILSEKLTGLLCQVSYKFKICMTILVSNAT